MEAIAHDQELEHPPSRSDGLEAIGIIDLTRELTNDALDDVAGPGHSGMSEVHPEVWEFSLEVPHGLSQSVVEESRALSLPFLAQHGRVLSTAGIAQAMAEGVERLHQGSGAVVEVAQPMVQRTHHVSDAELLRECREDLVGSGPEGGVFIQDQAFHGVGQAFGEMQDPLPSSEVLVAEEPSQRDVLGRGIRSQAEGILHPSDVDGLPIGQEIPAPMRPELGSNLGEGLALSSQGLYPGKDGVWLQAEFAAHRTVGGFGIEVTVDRLLLEGFAELGGVDKRLPAALTPVSLDRQRGFPSNLESELLDRPSPTMRTLFFPSTNSFFL